MLFKKIDIFDEIRTHVSYCVSLGMHLNDIHLIDTHCHLYHSKLEADISDVCDRAHQAGVKTILLPAITLASIPLMDKLTHRGIRFGKMAGIHPCDVTLQTESEQKLLQLASAADDIVAIGETGLDYYWSKELVQQQHSSFRYHLKLASSHSKPIVIHNRDSTADMLRVMEEEQDGNITGVWHCFNGTYDEGMKAIELGLYLGIGGVVTYKNSGVAETLEMLPKERIVLETDSPFLAPAPHRGKRNEPSYVRIVAEKVAEVWQTSIEDVAQITTANAERLFTSLASNRVQ
jgi:TatD DNase family protein